MKPIEEITEKDLENIKLIVLDVDGVIVPRGTKIKQQGNTTAFETKKIAKEQIEQLKKLKEKGFLINITSGRGLYMLQEMFRKVLDYASLTYENGSASLINGKIVQHINSSRYLRGLHTKLEVIKDHPNFKGFEPKELIITIHCKDEVPEIPKIVEEHNKEIKTKFNREIYCIWNKEAYDIGVREIQTKAVGLKYLIDYLGLKKENTLAIGDNLNDKELLDEAGIKVTADKDRLKGDFHVPLLGERLPAAVMIDCILSKNVSPEN